MHDSAFQYLTPTEEQKKSMQWVRDAALEFYNVLEAAVPNGPDKSYLVRKFREVAMWANVAITRGPDGEPRS